MKFTKEHQSFTVAQLLKFHANGKINLNPGFQRGSVWTGKQQGELIESLLIGMPIPNMFFWRHKEGNKVVYDVIDGKQRMEAILAFTRKQKPILVRIDPQDDPDWNYDKIYKWNWKEVEKDAPKKWRSYQSYEIPVVVVDGDLADIEKLFIKINSTGSKLTKQEMLNAKWHRSSKLLSAADKIASSFSAYFVELGILSHGQISRMKSTELMAELLLSMEGSCVLNKKDALNSVMKNEQIHASTLKKLSNELSSTLRYIKKFFPDIKTTRFKKIPDFYALAFALWRMDRDGYSIKSKENAELAFSLLRQLSVNISEHREAFSQGDRYQLKSPAREYHATVVSGSDSAPHRRRRVEIIESLIRPIFEARDSRRSFSEDQKQLLWHKSGDRRCPHCGEAIEGWNDVHVDHVHPYARAGRTSYRNGRLLHAKCNQELGVKGL